MNTVRERNYSHVAGFRIRSASLAAHLIALIKAASLKRTFTFRMHLEVSTVRSFSRGIDSLNLNYLNTYLLYFFSAH